VRGQGSVFGGVLGLFWARRITAVKPGQTDFVQKKVKIEKKVKNKKLGNSRKKKNE